MQRESINDYYIDFRGSIKWVCIVCTFFPNLIILDDAETMKKKKDSFEYMYLARPRLRKHFYE